MLSDEQKTIIENFREKHICILGDVILDEYVWGHVNRISPEAPVPVLEIQNRTHSPGGAANVAANIVSLGGKASLLGVKGDDYHGRVLESVLSNMQIDTAWLVTDHGRPTTTKTRIVAHSQQIARLDREFLTEVSGDIERTMKSHIDRAVNEADAFLISDYNKGVVTNALAQHLIERAHRKNKPVVVDPKGDDYSRYRGADVVKPNMLEAEHALKKAIQSEDELADVCRRLTDLVQGRAILLTRGEKGMTLFEKPDRIRHIPARTRNVYDVTGAGDTVVSVMALALAGGAPLSDAAELANIAAGIVVGKVGTATVDLSELLSA